MANSFQLEIRNLREWRDGMERKVRDMRGEPMLQAIRDAALWVTRDARMDAPVDTGRLRASITPEVRIEGNEVIGVVGSNVEYAPFMEFGTRPHWPPVSALQTWSRRHGMSAFLVARAISRRGLKARRFLRGALEINAQRIAQRINQAVAKIIGG